DEPVRRAQPGDTAVGWGREDRPRRPRADREWPEAGGHGRARTKRRPAAPVVDIPGGLPGPGERGIGLAVPHASRELDHGELRHEHGACSPEARDNGRVVVEGLIAV